MKSPNVLPPLTVVKGEAPISVCPVGGAPVAAAIGAIMGQEAGAQEAVRLLNESYESHHTEYARQLFEEMIKE